MAVRRIHAPPVAHKGSPSRLEPAAATTCSSEFSGIMCGDPAAGPARSGVLPGGLSQKIIAGQLAAKCVERFKVPSIVLAPSPEPGLVVGSGRSVAGFGLAEALEQFRVFFRRFGGHAQAVGLTMPLAQIDAFAKALTSFVEGLKLDRNREIPEDGELVLAMAG